MNNTTHMMRILILSAFATLMIYSCGIKKKSITEPLITQDTAHISRQPTAKDFLSQKLVYTHFKGSSETDLMLPNLKQGVTINIKSIFDKQTHASVRAGGFGLTVEAGQLYLSQDSIVAMDKINTQYYLLNWSDSETLLKMPLTLAMFQNLIVGNPPLDIDQVQHFNIQENIATISQVRHPYSQKLTYNVQSKKLEKIELLSSQSEYKLVVNFSEFKIDPKSNLSFPTVHFWDVSNGYQNNNVNWYFEEFEFNQAFDIKFSVPFRYRKSELK